MKELELLVAVVLAKHVEHLNHLHNRRTTVGEEHDERTDEPATGHTRPSTLAPLSGRATASSRIPCHLLQAAWMVSQWFAMAFSPRSMWMVAKSGSTNLRSSNAVLILLQYVSVF